MSSRAWPRHDVLPIIPLSAGWTVVISSEPHFEERASSAIFLEHQHHSGWRRDEMVVQVVVPKPAHRLIIIGSPVRFFNYTDRWLFLAFLSQYSDDDKEACMFRQEMWQHATAPASLLGVEQPYDPQWLGLKPSPLEKDEESSMQSTSSVYSRMFAQSRSQVPSDAAYNEVPILHMQL
jgi:hypothetical protein